MTISHEIRSPRIENPISRETLRRAVHKSTIASAALEGHQIPDSYVRPEWVTKFLADRNYLDEQ